jgi:plastocyanin
MNRGMRRQLLLTATITILAALALNVASVAASPRSIAVRVFGNGTVKLASGQYLSCGGSCSTTFNVPPGEVTLIATPKPGWTFVSWSGKCLGAATTCRLSFGTTATVRALFAQRKPTPTTTTPSTPSTSVTVTAGKPTEFAFTLSTTTVPVGVPVHFDVSNAGSLPHDFKVCATPGNLTAYTCDGNGTAVLGPETTITITFTSPGTYEYLCTIAGHAQAGMKGALVVK